MPQDDTDYNDGDYVNSLAASTTSPQKPPTTYTRVNDFGPHTDLIFRGATYMCL